MKKPDRTGSTGKNRPAPKPSRQYGPVPDGRWIALRILDELDRCEGYSDALIDESFRKHPSLDDRERGLASTLVYGTLRWRNTLDAHVENAAKRPLSKIDPALRNLLRMSVFQILKLDRIPDRAAVSEGVNLARKLKKHKSTGFVNGVLRKVAAVRELAEPSDPDEALSLLYGCPGWLVKLWRIERGAELAEKLARAASMVPPIFLRIDLARVSREEAVAKLLANGVKAGPGRWTPEGIWTEGGGDPRRITGLVGARCVVQGQASQLIAHLCDPKPGQTVLDGCSAPGLKTTHLAQLMGGEGRITALELHPHRVKSISALADRLGFESITSLQADSSQWTTGERYDLVLVDAPCSGLGVLSRNPESKWRRKPDDPERFAELQLSILENLSRLVKPGGALVYATCTTTGAENEGVVDGFLSANNDFAVERPADDGVSCRGLIDERGYFSTVDFVADEDISSRLDGFFGVRMRRR